MTVEKRDGKIKEFDTRKIEKAVLAAAKSVKIEIPTDTLEKLVKYVVSKVSKLEEPIKIDDIQNAVEDSLMKYNLFDVERAFHDYRKERDRERFKKFQIVKEMDEAIEASKVQNSNANMDESSFGGKKGTMDAAYLKEEALEYRMSERHAKNHRNNRIYIHDLDSYSLGMHNCFGRDTRFLTDEGIKAFYNFNDGDSVNVLCYDGKYHKATVKFYGKKSMNRVTFKRSNLEKTVLCTPDHRWILKDDSVTTNLTVGNTIKLLSSDVTDASAIKSKRNAEMFAFGFVLGDGCDKNNKYVMARLCGAKMQYKSIFEKAGYHIYDRDASGDETFIKDVGISKQSFLTGYMWRILSAEDKAFLFAGYFAADGHNASGNYSVSTSDERMLTMIEDISFFAGYNVFNKKTIVHDTNYKSNAKLYTVSLSRGQKDNTPWRVTKIVKANQKEYEAWCVEEPDTHSFILENGLITGNCLSIPFDDMVSNEVITRQAIIRPAGSINTFFQLIAVGKQLQSLQQFGGVSATHIDWSAVPFFRKSLRKHYCAAMIKSTKEFEELNLSQLMFEDREEWVEIPYIKEGKEKLLKKKIYINRLEEWISDRKERLLSQAGLVDSDFFIGSSKLDKTFFQAALYDTIVETKQAVEGLLHNLNTLQSRSGNQLPFSSINYGTCTLEEGRIIIKAILDATIHGTGKGATSIFPCQIFQMQDGVNCREGDPNYDLFKTAIRCTAKRMYPNYANCDWTVDKAGFEKSRKVKAMALELLTKEELETINSLDISILDKLGLELSNDKIEVSKIARPYEIMSTMGCRTYNGFDINFTPDYFAECLRKTIKDGRIPLNYLLSGNQKDGRGNIAPATIILPTLAMEAKKKAKDNTEYIVDYFMDILEHAISDCKDELIERFNWICAQKPSSAAFMWQNNTMKGYNPEDGIRSAMLHGTLAIGQLGLAETLQILIGKDQTTEEGMKLAKRIEQLYNDKCREYKEEWRVKDVTTNQVYNKMVSKIEEKECRKLSETEKKDIYNFCLSKKL